MAYQISETSSHRGVVISIIEDLDRIERRYGEIVGRDSLPMEADAIDLHRQFPRPVLWCISSAGYRRGRVLVPFSITDDKGSFESALALENYRDLTTWLTGYASLKMARYQHQALVDVYRNIEQEYARLVERVIVPRTVQEMRAYLLPLENTPSEYPIVLAEQVLSLSSTLSHPISEIISALPG